MTGKSTSDLNNARSPWIRDQGPCTWVNVRVWSDLDFAYHALRWRLAVGEEVPVSRPPLLYVDQVNTY